jgi:hypothetical protein
MREVVQRNDSGGWNAQAFAMVRSANVLERSIWVTFTHDGHAAWWESRYAWLVDVHASERKTVDDPVEEDEGGCFVFGAMFCMWR